MLASIDDSVGAGPSRRQSIVNVNRRGQIGRIDVERHLHNVDVTTAASEVTAEHNELAIGGDGGFGLMPIFIAGLKRVVQKAYIPASIHFDEAYRIIEISTAKQGTTIR